MKKKLPFILLPFILHASFLDTLENKIKEKAYKQIDSSIEKKTNVDKNVDNEDTNNSIVSDKTINLQNKTIKNNNVKIKTTTIKTKLEKIIPVIKKIKYISNKRENLNNFNNDKEVKKVFESSNYTISKNQKITAEEYQLILLKTKLDKDIVDMKYKKMLEILHKINNMNNLSKKIKMKFLDYTFWQVIYNYVYYTSMSPKEQMEVASILQQIVSLMDTNYNFELTVDNYIYKIISETGIGVANSLEDKLKNFYPYGINDPKIYEKFFKLLSSPLVWRRNVYSLVYYLKQDFMKYYNNNNILNEELINDFLKMLLNNGMFNGYDVYNVVKKLKYINPMNSNVYYYLSIYNKENFKKYTSLLEKSIKYNVNNIFAWKDLIKYLVNYRSKKFSSTKKTKQIVEYDNHIFKLINYVLNNLILTQKDAYFFLSLEAKLYYLEGTGFPDSNKLLKSAEIYYKLGNRGLVKQIIEYLIAMHPDKKQEYLKMFPGIVF